MTNKFVADILVLIIIAAAIIGTAAVLFNASYVPVIDQFNKTQNDTIQDNDSVTEPFRQEVDQGPVYVPPKTKDYTAPDVADYTEEVWVCCYVEETEYRQCFRGMCPPTGTLLGTYYGRDTCEPECARSDIWGGPP